MPAPTTKSLTRTLSAVQRAVLATRSFRANPAKAYGAALLVAAVFIGLRMALNGLLDGAPFLLFVPAIIVATFAGGVGGGIAAAIATGVAAWYFLLPDAGTWNVTTGGYVQLITYLIFAAFGAVMVSWLMRIAEHTADFAAHEQTLLRELQHRVKNHVQIVSSLLQIQSRRADPTTQAALQEAGRRLATISTVYGSLYRSGHQIDFRTHLEELCHVASRTAPDTPCEFKVNAEPVAWGMDLVMPLSLIASELIANAIRHGCAGQPGVVEVTLHRENGHVTLAVADTGGRLPDDFDVEKTKGLGIQLVRTLTRQIQGRLSAVKGTQTRFMLDFPESPQDPH